MTTIPSRELLDRARAAHPSIKGVDAEQFLAHLDALEILDATYVADLYLAFACLAAEPEALRQLDRRLRAVAPQALAGMHSSRFAADDILQDVREKLIVRGGESKLAQYSGKGPLDAWLRVTIARTALDRLRERDPTAVHRQDIEELARSTSSDVVVDALERRYSHLLREAVERGLASLSPDDRTLVQLHFVDGLNIDDLSSLLGVHRATAARRLRRAREHIKSVARQAATQALGVTEEELDSLLDALLSRIDVSLGR